MTTFNPVNSPGSRRVNNVEYIEEILPRSYRDPAQPTAIVLYNERLDLFALRIYGSNHSAVLRTILWANEKTMTEWMEILTEGDVLNTPPLQAVYFTRPQTLVK